MDSSLATLGFVIFGITFSIYAVVVESQSQNGFSAGASRTLPPHPPPPLLQPPLPSPTRSPFLSPSPAPSRSNPHRLHRDREPNAKKSPPIPPNQHHHHGHRRPPHQMNKGKTIGLLFAGIAGIMQIGVVGFLVFKRRQLLQVKDVFETSA